MIEEDVILEVATVIREAERKIQTRMAKLQTGDAFRDTGVKEVKALLIAAAVAGSLATAAPAQATAFHCSFLDHAVTCFKFDYEGAGAKVIPVPQSDPVTTPEEKAEHEAYTRKWVSFCKPEVRTDAEGIRRYHYAHAGCDLGRAE